MNSKNPPKPSRRFTFEPQPAERGWTPPVSLKDEAHPEPLDTCPAPPEWKKGEDKPEADEKKEKPLDKLRAFSDWMVWDKKFEQADNPEAESLSDDEFEKILSSLPEISAAERSALVEGAERRRRGLPDPWASLVACLRAPEPSPFFLAKVADLIEGNAIHTRASSGGTGTLTSAEVRSRHARYVRALELHYPKMVGREHQERATDIIAYELMQETNSDFVSARKKVKNAKRRKPTDEAVVARILRELPLTRSRDRK